MIPPTLRPQIPMSSLSAAVVPIALALLPLASPAGAPEHFEHGPPPGGLVRREHSVRHALSTRALRIKNEEGEQLAGGGFDVVSRGELLASDRTLESGAGRPAKFRRVYDRARLDADVGVLQPGGDPPKPFKLNSTGGLEGKSVVFTWVEEERDYGRYYDDEEGVEEDLARLLVDLDLAAFLPAEAVAPGDTWSVDPLALRHVVGPGGYLGFELSGVGDPQLARSLRGGLGTHMYEAFGSVDEGAVRATYRGRETVDGRELARIEVEFGVRVRSDLSALMNLARTTNEIDAGLEIEEYRLALQLEGKGEILWDPAGRHLARARFDGSQTVSAASRILLAAEGKSFEQELELAGSFEHASSARFVPDRAPETPTDRR